MINTIEIESTSRMNVQHTLYMDEAGKAIGCTCEARQFNSFKACRHMTSWNTTKAEEAELRFNPWHGSNYGAEQHNSYESCDYCGRNHTSWNCPF